MLYNTIVKHYFIYCKIIWGNTFTTYLKKLQNKILRMMTFSEYMYNYHTGPLFNYYLILSKINRYPNNLQHIYFSVNNLYNIVDQNSGMHFLIN